MSNTKPKHPTVFAADLGKEIGVRTKSGESLEAAKARVTSVHAKGDITPRYDFNATQDAPGKPIMSIHDLAKKSAIEEGQELDSYTKKPLDGYNDELARTAMLEASRAASLLGRLNLNNLPHCENAFLTLRNQIEGLRELIAEQIVSTFYNHIFRDMMTQQAIRCDTALHRLKEASSPFLSNLSRNTSVLLAVEKRLHKTLLHLTGIIVPGDEPAYKTKQQDFVGY